MNASTIHGSSSSQYFHSNNLHLKYPGVFTEEIPGISRLVLEDGLLSEAFIETLPHSLKSLSLLNVQVPKKMRRIDLTHLELEHLECDGVDWNRLRLPTSLLTLRIVNAKVHTMTEVVRLDRLESLCFSNCQFQCTKVMNVQYSESLKNMVFENVLPCIEDELKPLTSSWPDFVNYMIVQVPHVVTLRLPHGLECFHFSKRRDCNMLFMSEDIEWHDGLKNLELYVSGVYNSAHPDMPQENSLTLSITFPSSLERLVVRGKDFTGGLDLTSMCHLDSLDIQTERSKWFGRSFLQRAAINSAKMPLMYR